MQNENNKLCSGLFCIKSQQVFTKQAKEMEEAEDADVENQLLLSARRGEADIVRNLLLDHHPHVNCKGKNKANQGWTPLHLASYFGHKEVVELLLQAGADVNVVNDVGDTPLHRAAFTGRMDVVMLLLTHDADVRIVNAEGYTAATTAKTKDIQQLILAAESTGQRKLEMEFLTAAREGDVQKVSDMLKKEKLNINCRDTFGNTALHAAASQARKTVAVALLQNGVDTCIRNAKGLTALEVTQDAQMKQLLDVQPIKEIQKQTKRHEGPLLKKVKLRGWKPFWVVLERGVMSFFCNRADATTGVRRKGYKYLDDAHVVPHAEHSHVLSVIFSDKTSVMLAVEPSQEGPYKRQMWENAVKDHIMYNKYYLQGDVSDEEDLDDIKPLGSMQDALHDSEAHQKVLEKQIGSISNNLNTLTGNRTNSPVDLLQLRVELSQLLETSQKMCSSLSHCLHLFSQQEEFRKLQLEQETEKSRVLQEALTVLAAEHHELEQSVAIGESLCRGESSQSRGEASHESALSHSPGYHSPSTSPTMLETHTGDSDNNDEFFDCDDSVPDVPDMYLNPAKNGYKKGADSVSVGSTDSKSMNLAVTVPVRYGFQDHDEEHDKQVAAQNGASKKEKSMWGARSRLPVQQFSRNEVSVWSILKQCIGKELSKITMPVVFNEPLSFLQRLVEYMEYAKLLEKACQCDDPVKRLEYVAAFAVSATASNWERVGKPFNPLLGETYELDREDLGFRIVTEQVSHHPPVSAFHAESPNFQFHGAIHPKLKFWGKSVEVSPKGIVTLTLLKHGEVYTWHNVNCCIHNIIVGKLWIELYGQMEVTCHKSGYKAIMTFKPAGWFAKDLHKVEGHIYDSNKKKLRVLYGKWVEGLYSHDVDEYEEYLANHKKEEKSPISKLPNFKDLKMEDPMAGEEVPGKGSTCNLQLPGQRLLWECHPRPEDSHKYYNMSHYAIMLNEITDDMLSKLPHTDSRLRPDIRKLEEGDIDGAAAEKNRLEEKQRAVRKDRRKKKKEEWEPNFFTLGTNPHTGKEDWLYTGGYWNRNYENLPDIF